MAIRENDIFQFFAQKNDDTSNIRVNLSRDNFLKHQFPRCLLSGTLISATSISIILYTLQTFLTPKKEEYFTRMEFRQ